MRKRGCGIGVIIEGLVIDRHGVVTESAEEQIQKDIKSFLTEHGIPGSQKRNFYLLLETMYGLCNNAGPYKLIKGDIDYIKGGVNGKSEYEAPEVDVTLYELSYEIKFLAAVNIKDLYRQIRDSFKEMQSYIKSFNADSFAITVGFSDSEDTGLYLAIEKSSGKTLKVRVGYQEYIIEAATGAFGTEIGLPIDSESESTDVSGVSTPTGGFTKDKKKKVFPAIISEDEEEEEGNEDSADNTEEAEDIERLKCPECGSINVNSDGTNLICSDCEYSWTLSGHDEEDIRDNMLPQEDDIDIADYQKSSDYYDKNNEVECLQTQQNTDKSSLV